MHNQWFDLHHSYANALTKDHWLAGSAECDQASTENGHAATGEMLIAAQEGSAGRGPPSSG